MRRLFSRNQVYIVTALLLAAFVGVGTLMLRQHTHMPGADAWDTDFTRRQVEMGEIVAIGEKDGMTPIDQPQWQPAQDVHWLADRSPVIALHLDDPARAYPLAVLIQHGVVNDTTASAAVAVTFCPLCNSPVVYDRTLNGKTLRFGTTGTIRNSGMVMWDDATQSWWQQLTGEAIVGAYSGARLKVVPSQVVGFATFRQRYPDGVVLVGDASRPPMSYGRNPYIGYDSSLQPFMFTGVIDSRLPATERVLAGLIDGQPMAYPYTLLSASKVLNDIVGRSPVVAFWQAGAASALDAASIDESRDVGMAALFSALVEGRRFTFSVRSGAIVDDQTGSVWNIFGEAISGEMKGMMLMPYNAYPYFWFAWAANYPHTVVYEPPP